MFQLIFFIPLRIFPLSSSERKKQKENKEKADQIVKILSIVNVSCVEAD